MILSLTPKKVGTPDPQFIVLISLYRNNDLVTRILLTYVWPKLKMMG